MVIFVGVCESMLRQLRMGCFPGYPEKTCVILGLHMSMWRFYCPQYSPLNQLHMHEHCVHSTEIQFKKCKIQIRDFLKNTRLPKEHPAPSTELKAKTFSLEGLHNKQINYAPTKWGSAIKTWITVWFAFLASFHISLLLPLLEAMPEQSNDSQVWKSLLNISAC